jgi:hypothetical protein
LLDRQVGWFVALENAPSIDAGLVVQLTDAAANTPAIRFARAAYFVASLVHNCYGLPDCLPPWTDLTGILSSHRGLLLPGFRRVGRPPRRWI